jgi:hypothetical protein
MDVVWHGTDHGCRDKRILARRDGALLNRSGLQQVYRSVDIDRFGGSEIRSLEFRSQSFSRTMRKKHVDLKSVMFWQRAMEYFPSAQSINTMHNKSIRCSRVLCTLMINHILHSSSDSVRILIIAWLQFLCLVILFHVTRSSQHTGKH